MNDSGRLQWAARMLAASVFAMALAGCGGDDAPAVAAVAPVAPVAPIPQPPPAPVPPSITTPPASQSVQEPAPATFTVVASNATTYQWQRASGSTWADLAGATAASYTTPATTRAADDGAQFRVVVSGAGGSVTSVVVALAVAARAVDWQADARIAAGGAHSLAIKTTGELWSWGVNQGGALGRANAGTVNAPSPVTTLGTTVRSVRGAAWYSVALRNDGSVWAWGWQGNVGDAVGASASVQLPLPVLGLSNVRALSTRYNHTLALRDDGTVWGFGPEQFGAIGVAQGHGRARQIPGLAIVRQVAAGEQHSMALRGDGLLFTWGANSLGQLGRSTGGAIDSSVQSIPLTNVIAIAATSFRSYALKSDGTVWEWGGAAGATTPTQVAGVSNVVALAAGNYTIHVLRADGTVMGWGDNTFGRVGVGSNVINITTPTVLPGLANIVELAGGEFHAMALRNDGRVFAWGNNGNLQLTGGARTDSNAPIDTGFAR